MESAAESIDGARAAASPCRITFHGLPPSEPPRIEVRAWLARLGALTAPMTGGEGEIEALDHGHMERRYVVRMKLRHLRGMRVGQQGLAAKKVTR